MSKLLFFFQVCGCWPLEACSTSKTFPILTRSRRSAILSHPTLSSRSRRSVDGTDRGRDRFAWDAAPGSTACGVANSLVLAFSTSGSCRAVRSASTSSSFSAAFSSPPSSSKNGAIAAPIGLKRFYLRRCCGCFPAFAVLVAMFAATIPFLPGPVERTKPRLHGPRRRRVLSRQLADVFQPRHDTGFLGHSVVAVSGGTVLPASWPIGLLAIPSDPGMSRRRG